MPDDFPLTIFYDAACPVGGVGRGDRRVVDEREARDGDLRHAGAQIDGVEGELLEPGTQAAQRMADRVWKFFEHGFSCWLGPGIRRAGAHPERAASAVRRFLY